LRRLALVDVFAMARCPALLSAGVGAAGRADRLQLSDHDFLAAPMPLYPNSRRVLQNRHRLTAIRSINVNKIEPQVDQVTRTGLLIAAIGQKR
jgi:hypothetical protein